MGDREDERKKRLEPGGSFLTNWNKKHRTYHPREYDCPLGQELKPFFFRRRGRDDVPDLIQPK